MCICEDVSEGRFSLSLFLEAWIENRGWVCSVRDLVAGAGEHRHGCGSKKIWVPQKNTGSRSD